MKGKSIVLAAILIIGVTACEKNDSTAPLSDLNQELAVSPVNLDVDVNLDQSALKSTDVYAWAAYINEALVEYNIQLEKMEIYGADQQGIYVFFKEVGNKQLDSDFVPDDPRNYGGIAVPYVIDGTEMTTSSGLSSLVTIPAIMSAMNTWDEVKCSSGLEIPSWGVSSDDIGFVQFLVGFGGFPGYYPGLITHGGILSPDFFDAIEPGGGEFILGVTFTFIWTDDVTGDITDIDANGKTDVAVKEIYINDAFDWRDAPEASLYDDFYDFETVVLHEVGHGLSQAHFGKAFITKNGKLHFAPHALMNNAYTGALREITKSDIAGHCINWASWPQN